MNNIPLILKREYLTRVRKKSFVIMTILGPLFFAAMFVIPGLLANMSDTKTKVIAVVDRTGAYVDKIRESDLIKFEYIDPASESNLKEDFTNSGYYAFLVIEDNLLEKPDALKLYSDVGITIDVKDHVNNSLKEHLRAEKLKSFEVEGLDSIIEDINKVRITMTTIKLGDDGSEKESSTEIAMIISIICAFLTYMFVFIYGAQVMQGVMEEKASRIVEVIISSVRPFELMLGKIIGIALVALTQVALWIILTGVIVTAIKAGFTGGIDQATQMQTLDMAAGSMDLESGAAQADGFNIDGLLSSINSLNPLRTVFLFILYFIGGYMIYSSLYAAIGAAVDNQTDTQQFMMPITIPILIAFYVAIAAFRNPHSDLVFWFSMIPLTSPIVMMARVPFDVPLWEILVSLVVLYASFVFTTWFAARIYRVGILMYGKKVTYKELWKWFRYSDK